MKLYAFPASVRVIAINAIIKFLKLPVERIALDVLHGDLLTPEYIALNPNHKVPTLVDGEYVLWEANAILSYLANQRPENGLWPTEPRAQADVLRWLVWDAAHLDAESYGMVAFEKASKMVLGLGPADPAFISRGEQNFMRFADVLNRSLAGKQWLIGGKLSVADFAVGEVMPTSLGMGLPVQDFPEIVRWYEGLTLLPARQDSVAEWEAGKQALIASMTMKAS